MTILLQNMRFILIAFSISILYVSTGIASDTKLLTIHAGGLKHQFNVEIANTQQTREKGLMNRKEIAPDSGMLFILEKTQIAHMWMKNTLISLDMLFIDNDGVIKHIHRNAIPHSTEIITHNKPVSAILELPGGTVNKVHIDVGNTVTVEGFFE